MKEITNTIKGLLSPKVSKKDAYKMGYDCGLNGADEENCHFAIFSSPENTKEWERGKIDSKNKL